MGRVVRAPKRSSGSYPWPVEIGAKQKSGENAPTPCQRSRPTIIEEVKKLGADELKMGRPEERPISEIKVRKES